MKQEESTTMAAGEQTSARRGLLKALGVGTAVAAAAAPAVAQRADSVPARDARKESEAQRIAQRYQPNAAGVQAFYRTNRYE
jgi:hypothetical protein